MNKILILLMTFVVSTGAQALTLDPSGSTVFTNTGSVAVYDRVYSVVKNTSGGALVDGNLVILDTAEDNGAGVTTSATAYVRPHCMIDLPAGAACADDARCRCLVYGYTDKLLFDGDAGAATAGEAIYVSESYAGRAQGIDTLLIDARDQSMGIFYDSSGAASGSVEAFIDSI